MKYCKYCGMKLRDESRFCYRCGEPCAEAPASGSSLPDRLFEPDEEPEGAEEDWLDDGDDPDRTDSLYRLYDSDEPEDLSGPDGFHEAEDLDEPDEEYDTDGAEAAIEPRRFYEADEPIEGDGPEEAGSPDETGSAESREGADSFTGPDETEGFDGRDEADGFGGSDETEEFDGPGGPEDFIDPDEEDEFEAEADEYFDDEETRIRRRKRRKTRRLIAVAVLAALAGYIAWSPARRAFMSAASGDTEKAVALYKSEVFPNRAETLVLSVLAPFGIDACFNAYNRSDIHYEDAARRMETLGTIGNAKGTAERKLNQLDTLYQSKVDFLTGEKAREEGDYRAAMQAYRKVVKEDANYKAASELADQSEEQFVKDILKQASSASSNEEYEASINLLADAGKAVPDNREIADALSGIRQKYAASLRKTASETAASYIEQGYYKEAIDLVNEALKYNEQDAGLITLRNTAVNKYETFVTEQVDIYLKNKDLDGAVALLEKASADLPESKAVAQLYTALKES